MNWETDHEGLKFKITLPDRLPDGVPFEAVVGGKKVRCLWDRGGKTLILIDDQGLERPISIRSSKVERHGEESGSEVHFEAVFGSRLALGATLKVRPDVPGQAGRARAETQKGSVIRSPITGKVLKIEVEDGQEVEAGQSVCIIEAMKMENRIFAPAAGHVHGIKAREGVAITVGEEILRLK